MPDVLSVQAKEDDDDAIIDLISQTAAAAIEQLLLMRKQEGEKQKEDFFEKAAQLEISLENIKKLAHTVVDEYRRNNFV